MVKPVGYYEAPGGTHMVREEDGTERPTITREQLDYLHEPDRRRLRFDFPRSQPTVRSGDRRRS